MVRSWCMRYEAKHSYFKRLASYMGNFTNVALSLGERHQTRSCYLGNEPLAKKPKIGNLYFFTLSFLFHLILPNSCL